MEAEGSVPVSVASVVEDVLKNQGKRINNFCFGSRKAEETSLRRYEAAEWLRKMVGVVGGKDLASQPSEEHFRLALRSGITLCRALNKVQPGSIPKVVEAPSNDSVLIPDDGAALSAFQYFENIRNFLVAVEELGLPTFEASDLEQGGKSSRIVDCVLALKSYSEWKQGGGTGSFKMGVVAKPISFAKPFARKNTESFTLSRNSSTLSERSSLDGLSTDQPSSTDQTACSLNTLVHTALSGKRQEEVASVVESMLSKVMEEFERRLTSQNELIKTTINDSAVSTPSESPSKGVCSDTKEHEQEQSPDATDKMDGKTNDCVQHEEMNELDTLHVQEEETGENADAQQAQEEECDDKTSQTSQRDEASESKPVNQIKLIEQQQRHVQELKHNLHSTKADMKLLQMKYQEEFTALGKHLHSLSHAASGYQRVVQENCKLYNQLQDLKGNIRVYCRVRPLQTNRVNIVDHIEEGNLTINTPLKYGKEGKKSFTFNKVFDPTATQADVFSDMQPLIRSVLDGYNVCIFAYGQTGSGKTHTMTGPDELTEETQGVNYRALGDLFLLSEQRADLMSYDIYVQMIEIYNEQVRDLLATDGINKKLEIRNSTQNGINVPEANLVPVSSTDDVISLMNLGQKNRAVSSTAMNDRSSRSHSCLTVHVQGRDLTTGKLTRGSMHLVDLAGSERVDKSEVTGDRLKEAVHINKSLSALGDVIASLAQKGNNHVPYRNSKLTQLLQDSLGGQAKTLMFVHISPEPEAVGETISTLKFAERVATVELGAARVNKDDADVNELKEEIASLKAALAKKDGEMEARRQSQPSTHRKSLGNANLENNAEPNSRRQSFDLHDLASSPSWSSHGKEDDKESTNSSEWLDSKYETSSVDENQVSNWRVDSRQLPAKFYQKHAPNTAKVQQSLMKPTPIRRSSQTRDDESETATSDSSEQDLYWQSSFLPRVSSVPAGIGTASKIKKPQTRSAGKPQEARIMIPTLIPSPSRKVLGSGSLTTSRSGKLAVHADGKRRNGKGK